MRPDKIVIREVQSNGGFKVLKLLAERIREPSKPFHVLAGRSVRSFDIRSADEVFHGTATDRSLFNADYFGCGVSATGLSFKVMPKGLDYHSVVNVGTESVLNSVNVGGKPVSGNLRLVLDSAGNIFTKA